MNLNFEINLGCGNSAMKELVGKTISGIYLDTEKQNGYYGGYLQIMKPEIIDPNLTFKQIKDDYSS